MVTRRSFLASTLGAAAAVAARAQSKPLNFLFILIDDMGWRDLGCFGAPYYKTPNIDRLAAQGMRFTSAYAACPVCSPTRASIMTGRYPASTGVTDWIPGRRQGHTKLLRPETRHELPLAEVTIAEALKPLGYRTASIGKWHLGGEGFSPLEQGFDVNVAGGQRGSPLSYFGPFKEPGLQDSETGEYLTDRLSTEVNKFLDANASRPFFLYLPEFAVHLPAQAKKELIAKYEGKPINATYAAMIESLDEGIGRIMRKLDELKIANHTVVFFMSDNGGLRYEGKSKNAITDNAPLRAGKGHLYEGGIREPLFVRWPGVVKPGTACDEVVSSVDFFPTILQAAGAPARNVDGESLMPLLKQTGKLKREAVYWHYPHYANQGNTPGAAIRQGDWKLIEFFEDGRLELFNIRQDIGETRNLVKREPKRVAAMHANLKAWQKRVGAVFPAPNPGFDPSDPYEGLTGLEAPIKPVE